jgi:NADPH:quinone reductase-like Zn-dependent oxidoreductase
LKKIRYGVAPPALPAIAGIEGVGSIAAVGSGVKNLKPNDRVIPVGPWFGIKLPLLL